MAATTESAQETFDKTYISSSEICKRLAIPRSTIASWKKTGKLPNPIEQQGENNFPTFWERNTIEPILVDLKDYLDKRRGISK